MPQATPDLEERLGTRWVVWVGGLTLALGGFFMVPLFHRAGPAWARCTHHARRTVCIALLTAGEWTRRWEGISAIAPLPTANIPAILTAAGTAVAFATVYAAYALYDVLVPGTAFVLLGIVAMGTLAAALLHGPALAGLGIAGAFVTPVLISSDKPDYWALYIYLAIVTAAAFALARARLWRWLAVTTVVFAVLWICLASIADRRWSDRTSSSYAGFVLATLLVVCGFMFGRPRRYRRDRLVSSGSLAAYLLAATGIVLASFHADTAMIVFGLLSRAGICRVEGGAATGAVGAAAASSPSSVREWAVRANPDMLVLPGGPLPGMGAPDVTDGR